MLALLFCRQGGAKTCLDVTKLITIAFITQVSGKPLERKYWPATVTGAKYASAPGD